MHHLHASSGHWLLWVAGGCALLAIFSVVGTAFVVGSLVYSFATAGRTCLPSDFPQYPSATVRHVFTYTGPQGIAPGDAQECQENLDAKDALSTVDQFYAKKLASADWNLTNNDAPSGHLDFKRVSRPKTVGYIQLLAGMPFPGTVSTRIEIRLDS